MSIRVLQAFLPGNAIKTSTSSGIPSKRTLDCKHRKNQYVIPETPQALSGISRRMGCHKAMDSRSVNHLEIPDSCCAASGMTVGFL